MKSVKDYVLKDAKFMSTEEKRKTLLNWEKFLQALCSHYPNAQQQFTKRLYNHLHLHCSFIAHYDIGGFYCTYFKDPSDTIRFIKQFDANNGGRSAEMGGSWWLSGDMSDINNAMCDICAIYKDTIYEKMAALCENNDLAMAQRLAEKHGYKITK